MDWDRCNGSRCSLKRAGLQVKSASISMTSGWSQGTEVRFRCHERGVCRAIDIALPLVSSCPTMRSTTPIAVLAPMEAMILSPAFYRQYWQTRNLPTCTIHSYSGPPCCRTYPLRRRSHLQARASHKLKAYKVTPLPFSTA
jgi:hypothetical protein